MIPATHHSKSGVVTDAERDRATRLLRERYANGAPTISGLDVRLDAVLAATSEAELHAVLRDDELDQLPTRMLGADIGASDLEPLGRQLAPSEEIYWIGHPETRVSARCGLDPDGHRVGVDHCSITERLTFAVDDLGVAV